MIKTRVTSKGVISEIAQDGIAEFILEVPSTIPTGSVGAIELGELEDVDTSGAQDGNALVFNQALLQWEPRQVSGASAVSDLTDVDLTGLQDGQVLIWDENVSQWVPNIPSAVSGNFAQVAFTGDYADLTGSQSPSTVVSDFAASNDVAIFQQSTNELGILTQGIARFNMGDHNGLFIQNNINAVGNFNFYEGQLSQMLVESDDPSTIATIRGTTVRTSVGGSGVTEQIGSATFGGEVSNLISNMDIFGGTDFGSAYSFRASLNISENSTGSNVTGIENQVFAGDLQVARFDCLVNTLSLNNGDSDVLPQQITLINTNINVTSASYVPVINTTGFVDVAENIQVYTSFMNAITASQNYQDFVAFPNIGYVENYSGIIISPNIDFANNSAVALSCSTNNVTGKPGQPATATIGDVFVQTVQTQQGGPNIQFIDGATAGNESFFFDPNTSTIVVVIETGVTTAQQIVDLMNFEVGFFATFSVTGTGNEPQGEEGPVPLAGGENPAYIRAGQFNGDVEINGDLIVNGEFDFEMLKLDIFNQIELENTSAQPVIANEIGTFFTLDDFESVQGDHFSTICLAGIEINEGVTVVPGPFGIGVAAVGAINVLNIGDSSEVDTVVNNFSVSLIDSDTSGGTVKNLVGNAVRFLPLDAGATTVQNSYAFRFDVEAGPVSNNMWGVWIEGEDVDNYMEGNLQIEGALVVGDSVEATNDSVGIEINSIDKVFLNARLSEGDRDNLNAVDGMLVYNTTTDKLQVRANGTWVDLH